MLVIFSKRNVVLYPTVTKTANRAKLEIVNTRCLNNKGSGEIEVKPGVIGHIKDFAFCNGFCFNKGPCGVKKAD